MPKSERWRTCGRAALEGIGDALRAMRSAAVPGGAWSNDESDPKMVRAYALGDALEVVTATGWNFACACEACNAEDAAGVGFGEPLDGVTRCERCREPAEYVSATAAEVAACGACRPAFDAEPENAGVVWYIV